MASRANPGSDDSGTQLLLSVLGEVVLPHGGAAWTSSLVALLAELGIGNRNARQAISRLAEGGLLRNERLGRLARWHLTPTAQKFLADGAARIYGFAETAKAWDGHWLMVMCSVPEDLRAERPRLRAGLGFEGFGFLAPGVAICAHVDREPAANRVLHELGLASEAVVMRAEAGALSPDASLIARAWDLESLAADYREFIHRFEPCRPTTDPARCAAVVG